MFVFLSLIIILTNFKDIYNLIQFSKTLIRWKKSNKNTGHKLVEISTQVTPGLLNYVQSVEVPSWVTASGNLIFQVDKSVPFFLFHVEKSCLWLEFLSEIVTRRQPKKLNGPQRSWLWPEQVSVHLVGFLIFELLVSMLCQSSTSVDLIKHKVEVFLNKLMNQRFCFVLELEFFKSECNL